MPKVKMGSTCTILFCFRKNNSIFVLITQCIVAGILFVQDKYMYRFWFILKFFNFLLMTLQFQKLEL